MADRIAFGKALRQKHFLFKDGYVPLNNGSFGAFPRVVKDKMVDLLDQCEGDVDDYLRHFQPEEVEKSREATAKLLNIDSSSIVFLSNATTAVNVVLRSLPWQAGDVIILIDIAYGAFEKTVEYIVETTPASVQLMDIKWPCEDDELVAAFEKTVQEIKANGQNPRLFIFDTIASMPGIRLPFERLAQKSKELGVLSFLDGAHGIGQIEIDLATVRPDFFTSNLHKWLFVPRGCAILYVSEENQSVIRSSMPTSWGFTAVARPGQRTLGNPFPPASGSAFHALFHFAGTANTDPYLTIPTALSFREHVCGGERAIMDYMVHLARVGGDRVAEILGTEVFDNKSGTLRQCAFANIRVPLEYGDGPGQIPMTDIGKLHQFFIKESIKAGTYFSCIMYHGAYWWRISATVMLEEADFVWGAHKMKELCDRAKKGEYAVGQE